MSKNTRGSDFAFPRPATDDHTGSRGLTIREYFAAMAMQAHIQRCGDVETNGDIVAMSVEFADDLIAKLSERESHE